MLNINKIIKDAKDKFFTLNKSNKYMDVDFVLFELMQNTAFFDYYKTVLIECGIDEVEIDQYVITLEKYCYSYPEMLKNMDSDKIEYLENRTNVFNQFLLFLLTQLRLISHMEEFLAVMLAINYTADSNIIGLLLIKHDIDREKLIEADQQLRFKKVKSVLKNKVSELDEKEYGELLHDLKNNLGDSEENEENPKNNQEELSKYYIDYTSYIKNNKQNKLIGRDKDLELIEQALFRKNKCGVVLVGKSGVGKDEIVSGFTSYLKKNSKFFKGFNVLKINTSALAEANVFRGQLESKVRQLLNFFSEFEDVIVYIEDLHTLFNKIRVDDDIAHALLPQIMNLKLRVIATCDYDEWTSIVEDNTRFAKYFQKIMVNEPDLPTVEKIISKNIKSFENHFNIKYDKFVPTTVVNLADKYLFNKCFPEKAFDLLDIVSSKFKYSYSNELLSSSEVTKLFGEINDIPLEDLKDNDLIDFKTIANNLKSVVISQDEAIDKIMNHIAINKAGLREDNKTVCNIFLKAQSGVGKTFLCQELAKQLHIKLVRFDMSEYSEQHSVAKFLGTPPGYVGFSDANHGSLLISALEQSPRCVLLLDEIEKANDTIHNVLLQAMDNGKITSTTGKEVSLKDVILVMTSNVGATASDAISFGETNIDSSMEHFDQIFKPEFKTRLDDIITLNPVSKIDIKRVITLELNKINPMIKKYKKKITWTKDVIDYIEEKVRNNNLGLRIVKHIIDSEIKIKIVEKLNSEQNLKLIIINNQIEVAP